MSTPLQDKLIRTYATTKTIKPAATYNFDYCMRRLRDAIEYAEATQEFVQVRLWAMRAEEAYNADIQAERELTANANEGAKLMHSVCAGMYDTTVDHPIPADLLNIARWQDETETTRKSDYPR